MLIILYVVLFEDYLVVVNCWPSVMYPTVYRKQLIFDIFYELDYT